MSTNKSLLISSKVIADHVAILVAGEINGATSSKLEQEMMAIIDGGQLKIVVSLENVSLITSAGLRVLLVTAKKLRSSGGDVALYDTPDNVMEIFKITGFNTILNLSDSYEAAAKSVGADITSPAQERSQALSKHH